MAIQQITQANNQAFQNIANIARSSGGLGPVGGGAGGSAGGSVAASSSSTSPAQGLPDLINQAADNAIKRLGASQRRQRRNIQAGFAERGLERSGLAGGAIEELGQQMQEQQRDIERQRINKLAELARSRQSQAFAQGQIGINAMRRNLQDNADNTKPSIGLLRTPTGLNLGGNTGGNTQEDNVTEVANIDPFGGANLQGGNQQGGGGNAQGGGGNTSEIPTNFFSEQGGATDAQDLPPDIFS